MLGHYNIGHTMGDTGHSTNHTADPSDASTMPAGPGRNIDDGPIGSSPDFAQAMREAGIVDEPTLSWALEQAGHSKLPFYDLIVQKTPSAEDDVYSFMARFLGVELARLDPSDTDDGLATAVGSEFALANRVAPLARRNGKLIVVTSRPQMLMQANHVSTAIGSAVEMALGCPSRVDRYIQDMYGLGADTVGRIVSGGSAMDQPVKLAALGSVDIHENLDSNQEASVTQFVNQLLVEAVKTGASDIHIEPYEKDLRVRFRLDGILQEVPVPPAVKLLEQAIITRVKVLADLDIAEKRLSQDGQMRLSVLGRTVDVRVSVLPSIYGESLVLRMLDRQAQFRDLGEIGMPDDILASFRDVLSLAQGLVLVSGPTGSGKTTTLYAGLNHVNIPGRKIIAVEDPVEYRLDGLTQIQVKDSIGLSFSSLLRNIVRHDPDVVMVGEIRDTETAQMALNAAMTGHMVLATVHTNDAPSAVSRLASMGAPWYMIASALKVAIAQRLVRRLCVKCRKPADALAAELVADYPMLAGSQIYKACGCEACRHTGYKGRIGIFESLSVSPEMEEMITASGQAGLRAAAVKQGMVPLQDAGMKLVADGVTSLEELYRLTRGVAGMSQAIRDDDQDGGGDI